MALLGMLVAIGLPAVSKVSESVSRHAERQKLAQRLKVLPYWSFLQGAAIRCVITENTLCGNLPDKRLTVDYITFVPQELIISPGVVLRSPEVVHAR